jgi:hypothetical protein
MSVRKKEVRSRLRQPFAARSIFRSKYFYLPAFKREIVSTAPGGRTPANHRDLRAAGRSIRFDPALFTGFGVNKAMRTSWIIMSNLRVFVVSI